MIKHISKCATVAAILAAICVSCKPAQPEGKAIYIPREYDTVDFTSPESIYSYDRMAYTDDIVVLWQKGFGKDLANVPALEGTDMNVDLQRILTKTQSFYNYFKDTMKFILPGSKADTFRMMVMLNYSLEGTAYGGDYDGKIGALWVTPLRLRDEKLNCIAHELGHSFQAQLVIDNGSRTGEGAIYEMTSQWMLWQVNPDWITDENYHWVDFMKQTHFAFMHHANIYHSPYVLEYWSDKHGVEFIANLWRAFTPEEDVVSTYKRYTGIDQQAFLAEMYDAATKFMTYDMPRVREYSKPYANKHTSAMNKLSGGWYKIDASRTPQNYGYNGIELDVPAPGKTVTVQFEGLVKEVPSIYQQIAGWRYGLVAVPKSGAPIYTEMVSDTKGKVSYTAPEGEELAYLWLVVLGAPSEHENKAFRRPDPKDFVPDSELSHEEIAPSAGGPEDQKTIRRRRAPKPTAEYPFRIKVTNSKPICEIK